MKTRSRLALFGGMRQLKKKRKSLSADREGLTTVRAEDVMNAIFYICVRIATDALASNLFQTIWMAAAEI